MLTLSERDRDLHQACEASAIRIALKLIQQQGASLSSKDPDRNNATPFIKAVIDGHVELVAVLMALDLTRDCLYDFDSHGLAAFHIALVQGNLDIVSVMSYFQPLVLTRNDRKGRCPAEYVNQSTYPYKQIRNFLKLWYPSIFDLDAFKNIHTGHYTPGGHNRSQHNAPPVNRVDSPSAQMSNRITSSIGTPERRSVHNTAASDLQTTDAVTPDVYTCTTPEAVSSVAMMITTSDTGACMDTGTGTGTGVGTGSSSESDLLLRRGKSSLPRLSGFIPNSQALSPRGQAIRQLQGTERSGRSAGSSSNQLDKLGVGAATELTAEKTESEVHYGTYMASDQYHNQATISPAKRSRGRRRCFQESKLYLSQCISGFLSRCVSKGGSTRATFVSVLPYYCFVGSIIMALLYNGVFMYDAWLLMKGAEFGQYEKAAGFTLQYTSPLLILINAFGQVCIWGSFLMVHNTSPMAVDETVYGIHNKLVHNTDSHNSNDQSRNRNELNTSNPLLQGDNDTSERDGCGLVMGGSVDRKVQLLAYENAIRQLSQAHIMSIDPTRSPVVEPDTSNAPESDTHNGDHISTSGSQEIYDNKYAPVNNLFLYSQEYPPDICHKCRLCLPLRAAHCKQISKCVLVYDHYCYFLQSCICRSNYAYFLAYLLSMVTFMPMFLYAATQCYLSHPGHNVILGNYMLWTLLMWVFVCCLLVYHTQSVYLGLTSRERFKRPY